MELISDILLIAGALGAAFYCVVLSRRLRRFNDLEKGVGGAIAVLSGQVDDMTRTLKKAQGAATGSTASLKDLTGRAETVSRKLELLVAAMHDLPDTPGMRNAPEPRPGNGRHPQEPVAEADEFSRQEPDPSSPDAFRSRRN